MTCPCCPLMKRYGNLSYMTDPALAFWGDRRLLGAQKRWLRVLDRLLPIGVAETASLGHPQGLSELRSWLAGERVPLAIQAFGNLQRVRFADGSWITPADRSFA